MNIEWKLKKTEFAEFNMSTCGKIAVCQLCRERQPLWKSHDGLNENLFGSMPWCSLPWHKHLPRLKQKDCYTVYSLNLIHEFTSLFSTNLLYVGLRRKAFPGKQAKVDTGHQCFSVVAQATPQDLPKASPMAIFKWKNLMEQLDRACWVQRANMWKNCSLSAVQRKTAFVEESWWPECNLYGSMPWCSFPWHKHLPRLAQKDCCTVYSLKLIHQFTWVFRWRCFLQVCQGKPSHGNRKR